jgi:hypothetical protein
MKPNELDPPSQNQVSDYLETVLRVARPEERTDGTLPSVITSVDVKLTYDRSTDRFCPFIIGDINANPGGIYVHDNTSDLDILSLVAERFISNIDGQGIDIVVSLPAQTYDSVTDSWQNEGSWVTRDKKYIVNALQSLSRTDRIYLTSDADNITTSGQDIQYEPSHGQQRTVDGYVNLYDLGEALGEGLNEDIEMFSAGANAPSAVWNPQYPWTNKIGLLEKTAQVIVGMPAVKMPRFQKVQSTDGVAEFFQAIDSPVVLKGPYGTWGDEVIPIRSEDSIERRILEQERIVQNRRGWPEFSILDLETGELQFRSRSGRVPPISYGHVEEAIEDEFIRDGRIYDVVDIPAEESPEKKSLPIDFVPLVIRDESDTGVTVPSIMLRIAGEPILNANSNSNNMDLLSLEEAFHGHVGATTTNTEFSFNLKELLEMIAGRTVTIGEIQSVLELAGRVAFTARNLSAYSVESAIGIA